MFKLRPYEEKDYDFVYEVKKIGYQKYVEEFYGEWDETVQHEMFDSYLAQRRDKINIIIFEGKDVGFVDGGLLDDGRYEQGNICLLPEARGKGIGSKILENIISENKEREIALRVFKTNPAKRLYERFGFEVINETEAHFVMVRRPK